MANLDEIIAKRLQKSQPSEEKTKEEPKKEEKVEDELEEEDKPVEKPEEELKKEESSEEGTLSRDDLKDDGLYRVNMLHQLTIRNQLLGIIVEELTELNKKLKNE